MDPFRAHTAGTVTISVTGSSAATALPAANRAQYVLTTPAANTQLIFVEFGTSGQTSAVATGYPLLPGMKETVSVHSGMNQPTHIAAISASGTQTLYVTAGAGE